MSTEPLARRLYHKRSWSACGAFVVTLPHVYLKPSTCSLSLSPSLAAKASSRRLRGLSLSP